MANLNRKKSRPNKKKCIRQFVDQMMDEFNKETFPASDPPNWSSLRDEVSGTFCAEDESRPEGE